METYICSPARNWESVRLPFSRSKSLGEQRAGWHSSECFKVPAIEPEGAQGVWRGDFVRKMYRKMAMAINVITGYFYGIIMILYN